MAAAAAAAGPFERVASQAVHKLLRRAGCSVELSVARPMSGQPSTVARLLWQLVQAQLTAAISTSAHPDLLSLILPSEAMQMDRRGVQLEPQELLRRWANALLAHANRPDRVEDWLLDLVDSDAPSIAAVATVLLHEAAPAECGATLNALMVEDVDEQAQMLVDEMAMAGCTAFEVDAAAIVAGTERLHICVAAAIYLAHPVLSTAADHRQSGGGGLTMHRVMGPLSEQEQLERIKQLGEKAGGAAGHLVEDTPVRCSARTALLAHSAHPAPSLSLITPAGTHAAPPAAHRPTARHHPC